MAGKKIFCAIGTSYCGTPQLKFATSALESALNKHNVTDVPMLIEQFEAAVQNVLNSLAS